MATPEPEPKPIADDLAAWLEAKAALYFQGDLRAALEHVLREAKRAEDDHAATTAEHPDATAPLPDPWAPLVAEVPRRRSK